MNAVEHDQAQQASDRLVATLRSLSSGIRENFRSIEDATAPGRALARKHRAEAILKDTTADINCSADTMKSTCKELDSQESLKGVIQSLRRCQAADEKRMHQVLTHIADLGVQTQTLDSPSSWRRRQTDDAGAAECKGSEADMLDEPERTVSPQLPTSQGVESETVHPTIAMTFSIHESPAMGLLRPVIGQTTRAGESMDGPVTSSDYFAPRYTSAGTAARAKGEHSAYLGTETQLSSMASLASVPDSATESGAVVDPVLGASSGRVLEAPTAVMSHRTPGALSDNLSCGMHMVEHTGLDSTATLPAAAPSSFVHSLREESRKSPVKEIQKVKEGNDMIASVLARHNIKLRHWKGKN